MKIVKIFYYSPSERNFGNFSEHFCFRVKLFLLGLYELIKSPQNVTVLTSKYGSRFFTRILNLRHTSVSYKIIEEAGGVLNRCELSFLRVLSLEKDPYVYVAEDTIFFREFYAYSKADYTFFFKTLNDEDAYLRFFDMQESNVKFPDFILRWRQTNKEIWLYKNNLFICKKTVELMAFWLLIDKFLRQEYFLSIEPGDLNVVFKLVFEYFLPVYMQTNGYSIDCLFSHPVSNTNRSTPFQVFILNRRELGVSYINDFLKGNTEVDDYITSKLRACFFPVYRNILFWKKISDSLGCCGIGVRNTHLFYLIKSLSWGDYSLYNVFHRTVEVAKIINPDDDLLFKIIFKDWVKNIKREIKRSRFNNCSLLHDAYRFELKRLYASIKYYNALMERYLVCVDDDHSDSYLAPMELFGGFLSLRLNSHIVKISTSWKWSILFYYSEINRLKAIYNFSESKSKFLTFFLFFSDSFLIHEYTISTIEHLIIEYSFDKNGRYLESADLENLVISTMRDFDASAKFLSIRDKAIEHLFFRRILLHE